VAASLLTTLADVKTFEGITGAGDDALLTTLVAGVSDRMGDWMRREILSTAYTVEVHDARGFPALVLRHRPIVSVEEVRIEGVAIAAATYQADAASGILYRRAASDPYSEDVWPWGSRTIEVDYTAGFATVPASLGLAATKQVAFEFAMRGHRIRDRGTVLEGGSAQYLTGPWAPGVLDVMQRYRLPSIL